MFSREDLDQLTAELYAQKFADWIQPNDKYADYYINENMKGSRGWIKSNIITFKETMTFIGTTEQLHSKFVEENKGGDDE